MKKIGLQAEFGRQMTRVREISTARDEELQGGWYTEERMHTDLKYSRPLAGNQLPAFFLSKNVFQNSFLKKITGFQSSLKPQIFQ